MTINTDDYSLHGQTLYARFSVRIYDSQERYSYNRNKYVNNYDVPIYFYDPCRATVYQSPSISNFGSSGNPMQDGIDTQRQTWTDPGDSVGNSYLRKEMCGVKSYSIESVHGISATNEFVTVTDDGNYQIRIDVAPVSPDTSLTHVGSFWMQLKIMSGVGHYANVINPVYVRFYVYTRQATCNCGLGLFIPTTDVREIPVSANDPGALMVP